MDRAALRTTLTYRAHPRFTLGIEYNPLAGKVSPLANWLVVPEREHRPALMLGTSSDRIGTPNGQSFYATLGKSLKREIGLPLAPYVGVAYGTHEDKLRPIGGLAWKFSKHADTLVIFDGVNVHPTMNLTIGRHVFTVLLVEAKNFGVGYSVAFKGPEQWLD